MLDEPAIGGIVTASRDVTERRRAEEALRLSEERFRAAFESAPTAVALVGLDGIVVGANRALCTVMGFPVDEVVGAPFSQFVPADETDLDIDTLRAVLRSGEPQTGLQRRLYDRAGTERCVEGAVALVHDETGAASSFIVQFVDVSARNAAEFERKRAFDLVRTQNAMLRETDEVKEELISVVSHDIRTPLTSLMGYLELLDDEDTGPLNEQQRKYIAVMRRNAGRLLTLVNDLLFISRAEAEKLELDLEELDLADVARETVEALQPHADSVGVDLRLVAEPAPALVDRARIAELLENLLSNALTFTPSGGYVEVKVRPGERGAILEVTDTGVGMTMSDQRHLFERFFRGMTTQKVPGLGLGLSIVKAIVDAHGGMIAVTSRCGFGTAFSVQLPHAAAAEATRARDGAAAAMVARSASAEF